MATTGNVVCQPGYGKASRYVQLPDANDSLVLVILRPGHQDDQVLRDHTSLADLLAASGNQECSAANYTRGVITAAATETPDATNNRVDSALADYTWPALGAMSGTNAKQEQAAVLVCYRPTGSATDTQTLPLIKFYFPFIADGSDRKVPLATGFLRATGG